jgi:hypothetical protein
MRRGSACDSGYLSVASDPADHRISAGLSGRHHRARDFVKDFALIAPLTGLPLILAIHPPLVVSSVQELSKLRPWGFEPLGSSPEGFANFIASETEEAARAAQLKK